MKKFFASILVLVMIFSMGLPLTVMAASYSITFDSRGGTVIAPVMTDESGKLVDIPIPTKAAVSPGSYEFVGWYSDPVNGRLITTNTVFNVNTTIYARWAYSSGTDGSHIPNGKVRTILTTDGERDDCTSFARFLMMANEYDIEGIILTSSQFHWAGGVQANGSNVNARSWMGFDWMGEWIDAYSEGYENLIKHADGYPTPEYLRSITVQGNIINQGEYAYDTDGSNLIKRILLDKNDDRPVVIQAWGGPNTITAALRSIEDEFSDSEEWPEIYAYVSQKAILAILLDQDGTCLGRTNVYGYITDKWPDVTIWHYNTNPFGLAYMWSGSVPPSGLKWLQGDWVGEYLQKPYLNNVPGSNSIEGSLAAHILTWRNGKTTPDGTNINTGNNPQYNWVGDGDSAGFMDIIELGLRSSEDITYGGWGTRMERRFAPYVPPTSWGISQTALKPGVSNYFTGVRDPNTVDLVDWTGYNTSNKEGMARWIGDIQRELAVRATYLVDAPDANHPPVVTVDKELDLFAAPGAQIEVQGSATDPDGDNVKLDWFYYRDASSYARTSVTVANGNVNTTYSATVPFTDDGNGNLSFIVPIDAKLGDTIHMILTGTDDRGNLALSRYQRVIVTVRDPADYTEVEAAIELVDALDRDLYTWQSLAVVDAVVDAVVWDLFDIDQDKVDGFAAAINEAIDTLVLLKMINATASTDSFISIKETSKNSRVWVMSFIVTEIYNDGAAIDVPYSINLNGNNANLDGKYTFEDGHKLFGFTLVYDIKGNGSNIKVLEIIPA